ncbi:MAG: RnfABCDGE type electron transport complex subunit B [Clostridia bacterium]|nr:RnfABCDGE type electron transport complex subunit B [Clostridia bacterium]
MIQEILIPASVIGSLGLLFGVGLAYASKKFEVKVDERVAAVREALPGANCGGCGQTGCDGFAEGVVAGTCPVNGCPVGGTELVERLSEILGVKVDMADIKVARVMCAGTYSNCLNKFEYSGIRDCTAAANLYGGPSACSYGCVGLGNCARACPFGAIVMENGLARVIESKCTACTKCVAACPKKIIKMVSNSKEYTVKCSSLDKGGLVRKNCSVGCIGCGKCSKVCPTGTITLHGTLAEIIPDGCTNCGECIKVCPTKSIQRNRCGYVVNVD